MASGSQKGVKTHVARYNQSDIADAIQQEDFIEADRPEFPEKVLDMYDLEVVSSLLETDSSSFFAAYSRGDWDPTSIPPVPPELSSILGNSQSSNGLLITVEKRVTPPALEKSVEDAYRTYLTDAKTQKMPAAVQAYAHLTPVSEGPSGGTFFSDSALEPGLSSLSDKFMVAGADAAAVPSALPDSAPMDTFEGCGSPQSTLSALACATPPLLGFSLAATTRFAATGYLEAPIMKEEKHRRMAVRRFFPFGERIDYNLDRIIRLGKMMFSVNNAAISMVDTNYVHVSIPGGDPVIVPRGESMCSHTILIKKLDEPLVILDTLADWRFRNNPTVTGAWAMRFYAGYPLRTKDGLNVGTICLIDDKPRVEFTAHEKSELKELAQMVLRELESRQHERQSTTRDQMQYSIEAFNRDIVSESRPADQVALRLVEILSSTLNLEGVLILDAQRGTGFKPSRPNRQIGSSRLLSQLDIQSSSIESPELLLDEDDQVTVLAASRHATSHLKPSGFDYIDLMALFKESPDGVYYDADAIMPRALHSLLPPGITAAAAVLISRGMEQPFAVICVYTMEPAYAFELPQSLLTHLRAMGSILCTIQEKQLLSLADKAKVDFIANISHELRTPLHGVLASCDLLNETGLTEAQESLLDTAQACASSLAETINHVLDFTKANSRPSHEAREPVDLAWLIESTMNGGWLGRTARAAPDGSAIGELYAPKKLANNPSHPDDFVEPLIEIQPIDNWTVMVDKAGLRRILLNLIGNSMKFTTNGYVKVGLYQIGPDEGGQRSIEIVVEDTGLGMSSDFIREKLFHPFSQANSLAHGIGLGLAIVRSILKSSGIDGSIDVQSKLRVGTRMTVRLRAAVARPHDTAWYRTPQPLSDSILPPTAWCGFRTWHRGSVLIQNSLRRSLAQWYSDNPEVEISGARLLIVDSDGIDIEDLPKLGTGKPRILLLCSVPINPSVFKVGQEYSESGGICLTVIKPVGPHFLARALTKLLGNTPDLPATSILSPSTAPKRISGSPMRNPKPRPSEHALGTSRQAEAVEDYSQLRVLVVEDNPVNRKVLSAFLRKRHCQFVEACDGVEGVEAFQKYPAGYFRVILMDLQMPRMDGISAAKEIRAIESHRVRTRSIQHDVVNPAHIFALTGLASSEDRERALNVGFNGYLVKPMAFKALDATFKSVLETLSN